MLTKKTKRYLMLLAAVGLLAIGAGGSGTFATFNATVSNNNNTFATGTLYLHDVHGSTTCASESDASNTNIGANVAGSSPTLHDTSNGCATLFTNLKLPNATGTIQTTLTGSVNQIKVSNLSGNPVAIGDEILVDDGGGHTQRFIVNAATSVTSGVTTIPVDTQTANATYTATSATATDVAHYASITLINAGSIDAKNIQLSTSCDDAYGTSTGTVSSVDGVNNTITLTSNLTTGIPANTTIKNGTLTVGTLSAAAQPGQAVLTFASTPVNAAASDTLTWSLQLTGGSGSPLCSSLPISVVETDVTFKHDTTVPALGCATPTDTGATALADYGCDWTNAPVIDDTHLQSPDSLNLASGGSNTSALDGSSGTRYFLVGIGSPSSGLTNASQNELATFDLAWKINQ